MHDEPPGQQHGRDTRDGQHRVDRDHDGDQQAQVELGEVGQQGLAVQRQVGQSHRRVAQLDRAHDQELVAEPAHQLAYGDGDGPGEGVRPRADLAGEGRGELAEQQGSRTIGQADGPGREDPAVDHALVHPPLGEDLQRDRGQHGVDRRQHDRHRQHPGGEEVPRDAGLEIGDPRGGHDRDRAAGQQQQERQQVRSGPDGLRRRVRNHDERGGHNCSDVGAERRGKLPPRPVPDNGVPERAPSDGRGFHGPPFRMGLDRLPV